MRELLSGFVPFGMHVLELVSKKEPAINKSCFEDLDRESPE